MASISQIKLVKSLSAKKNRVQHNLFVAEGTKITLELLQSGMEVVNIYATKDWLSLYSQEIKPNTASIVEISPKDLERMTSLSTPQEVIALVKIPDYQLPVSFDKKEIIIALDGIRDPGNLGTIIRIADWYGVKHIICSPDTVDVYNSKVVQSTMGSIARVEVVYAGLKSFLQKAGLPVYMAVLEKAENIHTVKSFKSGILVIGSEAHGISPEILEIQAHNIQIPRYGAAESLNAALATGIILDNLRRVQVG